MIGSGVRGPATGAGPVFGWSMNLGYGGSMSEVVRKIQWRWITEERRFFTIYRGWRCYVWQSDPGKLWEFSADYYDENASRGLYSCAATQSEAQTAALDSVDWEIDAKK